MNKYFSGRKIPIKKVSCVFTILKGDFYYERNLPSLELLQSNGSKKKNVKQTRERKLEKPEKKNSKKQLLN